MMDYFKQISPVSSISIQWSDQPRHPICLQVLYGAQSDHPWSRSDLLVRPIPSFLPLFSLSLSLKVRETFHVGRLLPLILVQPRASLVSPQRPPPYPPGISSIPFIFTHGFHWLRFHMSSMRIQFWTLDLLD
jgi:hypothetical protein